MEKVVLLTELRALASDIPDFEKYSPTSRSHLEWLGKASALLTLWDKYEVIGFKSAADSLSLESIRDMNVARIMGTLHRAIADLELQVPALPPQAFGPGAVYDFQKALRDLLSSSTKSLFIIDPYLDEQIFDAYLSTVASKVTVRLLARQHAAALKPTVLAFVAQKKMSVEVRSSTSIHDRVLFVDDRSCWVLGQSIKDAAKKPTYLAPLPDDAAQLKKADYEAIWTTAKPL
ncbi:MAG: hypothetical protein ACREVA_04155 [Burkholderiales bacterium]